MTNNKNKWMFGTIALAAIAIIFMTLKSTSPESASASKTAQSATNASDLAIENEATTKTIATEWQWQSLEAESALAPERAEEPVSSANEEKDAELPFTEQSVYNALQAVKIDEDGSLILDHDALIALDEALERIYNKLNEDSLVQLKSLIEAHLPGLAGQETAELVENYSQFLTAKDEFSRVYEQIDANETQSLETLQRDENLYAELQDLRAVYLGSESTEKLFQVSDANAKLMFETLKVGADQALTPEERNVRLAEAQAEHARQTIDIPNWGDRYDSFLTAKQNILDASISDSEKQNQLSSLLNDRFDDRERALIEHLALDVL